MAGEVSNSARNIGVRLSQSRSFGFLVWLNFYLEEGRMVDDEMCLKR